MSVKIVPEDRGFVVVVESNESPPVLLEDAFASSVLEAACVQGQAHQGHERRTELSQVEQGPGR